MNQAFVHEGDLRVPPLSQPEEAMRLLHSVIPLTAVTPEFGNEYVRFVRRLRESLHPRGTRDLRTVQVGDLPIEVDLGDPLGCDLYYGFFAHAAARAIFLALLRTGEVVVDVNAQVGLYSVPAAVRVGPNGAVHAFEQAPTGLELLTRNARSQGVHQRVHLHALQGGVTNGTAADAVHHGQAAPEAASVPAHREDITLDAYLHSIGVTSVDAVRLGTGDLGPLVLAGALETLRCSPDPVILVEAGRDGYPGKDDQALTSVLTVLQHAGFVAHAVSAAGRTTPFPDGMTHAPSGAILLVRRGGAREAALVDERAEPPDLAALASASLSLEELAGGTDESSRDLLWRPVILAMAVEALRELDTLVAAFRARMLLDSDAVSALVAQQAVLAEAAWTRTLERALLDADTESRERLAHAHHLEEQLAEQARHFKAHIANVEEDSRSRLATVQQLTLRSSRLAESLDKVKALLHQRATQVHALEQQVAELERERVRLQHERNASVKAIKRDMARLRARPEVAVGQCLRSAARRVLRLVRPVS